MYIFPSIRWPEKLYNYLWSSVAASDTFVYITTVQGEVDELHAILSWTW